MSAMHLAAFMAGHNLHHRGFADNGQFRLRKNLLHPCDHGRRACASDLFIKAERQLQWAGQRARFALDHGPD